MSLQRIRFTLLAVLPALAAAASAYGKGEPPAPPSCATTPAAEAAHQWKVLQRQIGEFKAARARTTLDERGRMNTASWGGEYKPTWAEMLEQTRRQEALVFETDRDPLDIVLRRTAALLKHLATLPKTPNLTAEASDLAALTAEAQGVAGGDAAGREKLFQRACLLRRRVAFANPLLDFKSVLSIKRQMCVGGETSGDHMIPQFWGHNSMPGRKPGGLFVLENTFAGEPKLRDILAGALCTRGRLKGEPLPPGGFLSPELSFDGKSVLFAYCEVKTGRPGTGLRPPEACFHVFRVNIDGTSLEQLTDGPWNDFDPLLLPDGRIAFISERRGGVGRCFAWLSPTYTLHEMRSDGSGIRALSVHETNEWQPSLAHDGSIVYTRWDYVDRGFNQAHHPWITTSDGRKARAPHGNYGQSPRLRPFMEMDLRAVPNSRKYMATATGHHYQAYGSLVLLDFDLPDDGAMSQVKRLTPEAYLPEAETPEKGGPQPYATAWPLSEDFWLCVYDADGAVGRGMSNNFGVYLADAFGNKELLCRDPNLSCLSPIPLAQRPAPPVMASTLPPPAQNQIAAPTTQPATRPAAAMAAVAVVNVYDSRRAWPEGTAIKALRVVQVLPRPTATPNRKNPLVTYATDNGTRMVLGTVPIECDGSAYFLAPAENPLYFQALDGRGLAVQSMRSDTYFQAGETHTCQGCHEDPARPAATGRAVSLALRRAPSAIQPDVDGSRPFSFPRLVQPVLEKNCVGCHAKNAAKAPDLTRGNWERNQSHWYASYINLKKYAFFYDSGPEWNRWVASSTIPGRFGARASRLFQMLDKGHHDLKLSPADLHRIALWLDCNCCFHGSFENTAAQSRGEVVAPSLE